MDETEILDKEKIAEEKKKLSFLPLGMFFQFIFSVAGGGSFIAGLISGFSVHFDMSAENNIGKISVLLIIVGLFMLIIGITIFVVLYKLVVNKDK